MKVNLLNSVIFTYQPSSEQKEDEIEEGTKRSLKQGDGDVSICIL